MNIYRVVLPSGTERLINADGYDKPSQWHVGYTFWIWTNAGTNWQTKGAEIAFFSDVESIEKVGSAPAVPPLREAV
jgi:hypothetical protein